MESANSNQELLPCRQEPGSSEITAQQIIQAAQQMLDDEEIHP
jgi:hypothetical protein